MKKKKTITAIVVVLVILGLIGWLVLLDSPSSSSSNSSSKVVSRSGLHWHAELAIMIRGEKQEIPANVGLGIRHEPLHTHDSDGIIHLEFSGVVAEKNLKLGEFFRIWGKRFDKECIFDFCAGSQEALKMLVNGQPNFDFENYIMKDGDRIEIVYE